MMDRFYGYDTRTPSESERQFFMENITVAGMATEDMKIIFNPYRQLTPKQQRSVGENEAARLFMREQQYPFDFDVTPQQRGPFEAMDSPYAKPENLYHLQSTILGRILSGDPSAGDITPEQQAWADKILPLLEAR
jgi:hypothetical protein